MLSTESHRLAQKETAISTQKHFKSVVQQKIIPNIPSLPLSLGFFDMPQKNA